MAGVWSLTAVRFHDFIYTTHEIFINGSIHLSGKAHGYLFVKT